MDHYSILDNSSSPPPSRLQVHPPEEEPQPKSVFDTPPESMRFPGEDGGRSLAETAERDLDATLQLLAERARYITGAVAATIAVHEKGQLICRACTGAEAQKVGARLQVGSGLADESIRTRRILRCNDAGNDSRIDPERCRKYGIVSAMVMPLARGPEVVGVFELLAGSANVFEERDVTALERLGEMVETALEHAAAAKQTSEDLSLPEEEHMALSQARASAPSHSAAAAPVQAKETEPPVQQASEESPLFERGNVGNCAKCGFPVSGRRKYCLDCEKSQSHHGEIAPQTPSFLSDLNDESDDSSDQPRIRGWVLGMIVGGLILAAFVVYARLFN